jgi:enamine deaminase RidA (YjgF/YER057c/UK114 family)
MKTAISTPEALDAIGPSSQATSIPPDRSTIQVAALPKGANVEIEAIAIKPD